MRVCVEYILNIYEKQRSRKKLLIFKLLQDFFGKKFLSKYSLSFVKILTFFCQNTHLPRSEHWFLLSKYSSPPFGTLVSFVKILTSPGRNTGFFCQNTHLIKQFPVQ